MGRPDEDIQEEIQSLLNAQELGQPAEGDVDARVEYWTGRGRVVAAHWADIKQALAETWSDEWTQRRRAGIERRRDEVERALSEELVEPDWLRLLPDGLLTAKQREACLLVHGRGLSLGEAAAVAGVAKNAMAKRYRLAEVKVERWWTADRGGDALVEVARKLAKEMVRDVLEGSGGVERLRWIMDQGVRAGCTPEE